MTIGISRELPLLNFEGLNMLCAWFGHPSEKLWPFEFLESFRCSISSVLIYFIPESDIWVKSYDHLNFSRASVVQFWVSRYVMRLNCYDEWKVMTIWISWELPLFNFECLYMLCAWIGHPSEKLWPFEFLESFLCSISSVSICYVPESNICVKSYEYWNFSRAFVVQFWVSRNVMRMNQTFERKVMTIWISRALPLFNFERLDILYPQIGHQCENLWPFWISRELPLFNLEHLDILCNLIGHPSEKL